ncbi:MAG: hypothetical protein HY366_02310 [Candidatus Aenigmarchaeota archaeon]|nr:hypothetical protein [Candidatus Aenigmarchaeota archaeon]
MDIHEPGRSFNLELKEVAKFLEPKDARSMVDCFRRYTLEDDKKAPLEFYGILEKRMNLPSLSLYPSPVKTMVSPAEVMRYDKKKGFYSAVESFKTRPLSGDDIGTILVLLYHGSLDPEVRDILGKWEDVFNEAESRGKL